MIFFTKLWQSINKYIMRLASSNFNTAKCSSLLFNHIHYHLLKVNTSYDYRLFKFTFNFSSFKCKKEEEKNLPGWAVKEWCLHLQSEWFLGPSQFAHSCMDSAAANHKVLSTLSHHHTNQVNLHIAACDLCIVSESDLCECCVQTDDQVCSGAQLGNNA